MPATPPVPCLPVCVKPVQAALFWALLALSCTGSQAQTVPLCVGDFPPYNSASLPDYGPVMQVTREAFQRSGFNISIAFLPWARLLKRAEAGECMIVGLWRNAERDQLFEFSTPVVRQELGLFGRVGRARGELRTQVIGVERGSYLPDSLRDDAQRRYPVLGVRQNFMMLAHQRVDLSFTDRAAGEYLLRQRPDLAALIEWKGPRLEYKDAHLAAARGKPSSREWIEAFERGLSKLKSEGSYQKLLKQAGLMMPG